MTNLSSTLYITGGYMAAALHEVGKDDPALTNQLASLERAIEDLRKQMFRGNPQRVATNSLKLAEFQQALFDDLHGTFEALRNQDNIRAQFRQLPHRYMALCRAYPKAAPALSSAVASALPV